MWVLVPEGYLKLNRYALVKDKPWELGVLFGDKPIDGICL
jgi:hypothetical protein